MSHKSFTLAVTNVVTVPHVCQCSTLAQGECLQITWLEDNVLSLPPPSLSLPPPFLSPPPFLALSFLTLSLPPLHLYFSLLPALYPLSPLLFPSSLPLFCSHSLPRLYLQFERWQRIQARCIHGRSVDSQSYSARQTCQQRPESLTHSHATSSRDV